MRQCLQAARLASQGPGDVADALPTVLEAAETCLDLPRQLGRLLEAGVENVDFGAGLLVRRDAHAGRRRRHGCAGAALPTGRLGLWVGDCAIGPLQLMEQPW